MACIIISTLRAGLDYDEEVYRSRNFRGMEQHNSLQNGFFIGWDYATSKTSIVENFKHGLNIF